MANEIELKLCVHEKGFRHLKDVWLPRQPVTEVEEQQLANTYFDTPDFALQQRKVALRLRRKNAEIIQTLKTKGVSVGGLHQRGEWEWSVPAEQLHPDLLRGTAFPEDIPITALQPAFSTNFLRTSALIRLDNAEVELAFDAGVVIASAKSAPLLEVELELKQGPVSAIFQLAHAIAAEVPVWLSDISKAERGYRLARPQSPLEKSQLSLPDGASGQQLTRHLVEKAYGQWLRTVEDFQAQPAPDLWWRLFSSLAALSWTVDEYRKAHVSAPGWQSVAECLGAERELLSEVLGVLASPREATTLLGLAESKSAGRLALQLSQLLAE